MKISKQSWHYRFNSFTQSGFDIRAETKVFTTCTYIRTTIRSFFQFTWMTFVLLALASMAAIILGSAVYLPVALIFGLSIPDMVVPFAGIVYVVGLIALAQFLYAKFFQEKLSERRERKLSLLRQAAADKKDGICTIVEFE